MSFGGIRVFLPQWKVFMVRSPKPLLPNEAVFKIQPNMNKLELKAYLREIYNVKVESVNTKNVPGKIKLAHVRGKMFGYKARTPSYKLAYVTLEEDFEFPDMFPEKEDNEATPSS
eukprot:m.180306 g.180306  ORF g.180306 m.180306 type:complete len:115 (-) comp15496_c0_seq4:1402-1746(-)